MYLSQRYGVEGFPLDYVVQMTLASDSWGDFEYPGPTPGGREPMPDFLSLKSPTINVTSLPLLWIQNMRAQCRLPVPSFG